MQASKHKDQSEGEEKQTNKLEETESFVSFVLKCIFFKVKDS